jgi:glycosyltransferase involved in cell wall biosynthesis
MMSQLELRSLTNIPTPYRIHFYEILAQKLSERDIRLVVDFMAHTEIGRHWTFQAEAWRFSYCFWSGLHPVIRGRVFHFNPGFSLDIMRHSPRWLLMAGSWFLPTVFLAAQVARARGIKTLFWSESNLAYVEHRSELSEYLRMRAMNAFDAYVVPGQWAREYVYQYAPSAKHKPVLTLPNVVNERLFRDKVTQLRDQRMALAAKWNLADVKHPILLMIARLEPIKGVQPFVEALITVSPRLDCTVLIAGEGTLHQHLDTLIQYGNCQQRIRLLGHRTEEEILELMSLADGFVLPSIGDPYPLSAIEAAFAGLPLLLSNRVGCHPEVLVPGENGWLFDPTTITSIQDAIASFCLADTKVLETMGQRSLRLAEDRFSTDHVVASFADELMRL